MTIASTARRVQISANGVQDTFTYSFEIFDQSEIEVYVDTTLKTISTHYTVTGVDADNGGTVIFTSGNIPADNTTVTIQANQALSRTTSFQSSGSFKSITVNRFSEQRSLHIHNEQRSETWQLEQIQVPICD